MRSSKPLAALTFMLVVAQGVLLDAQLSTLSMSTLNAPELVFDDASFAPARLGFPGYWYFQGGSTARLLPVFPDSRVRVEAQDSVLTLSSYYPFQEYLVDKDANDSDPGTYRWFEDTLDPSDRLMQLEATNGGDLSIGGTLSQNTMFDLAEAFWAGRRLQPGSVVVVDPRRGDAVELASRPYQPALVGVVSHRPGIVLGGNAFSVEALREVWGEEIANVFEADRPELEARVLAASEEFRRRAEGVESPAAYLDLLRSERADRAEPEEGLAPLLDTARVEEVSPEQLDSAYQEARRMFESALFDEAIRIFFAERFAKIALAGRVPVKVDASFAPVRAGDPLTSSPIPGVAMRATAAGPILGMALEPLEEGRGQVLALVDRGWYGGQTTELAGSSP